MTSELTSMPDNYQRAPYPDELADLVAKLRYREWLFTLIDDHDRGQGCVGLTLVIVTCGRDSYHPERGETYRVQHYMPVPPAAYNRESWQRWFCLVGLDESDNLACAATTRTGSVIVECQRAVHEVRDDDPASFHSAFLALTRPNGERDLTTITWNYDTSSMPEGAP